MPIVEMKQALAVRKYLIAKWEPIVRAKIKVIEIIDPVERKNLGVLPDQEGWAGRYDDGTATRSGRCVTCTIKVSNRLRNSAIDQKKVQDIIEGDLTAAVVRNLIEYSWPHAWLKELR